MTDLGLSKNVSPDGQNSSPRITKERKRAGAIKEQGIVTKKTSSSLLLIRKSWEDYYKKRNTYNCFKRIYCCFAIHFCRFA